MSKIDEDPPKHHGSPSTPRPLDVSETYLVQVRQGVTPVLGVQADENQDSEEGDLMELAHYEAAVMQKREIALHGVLPPEHPVYEYLMELFHEINLPEEKRCKVVVYKNSRVFDACCYVDGTMFISTRTLKRIPPYREAWQALLAHEQVHYIEEHSKRIQAVSRQGGSLAERPLKTLAVTRFAEGEADFKATTRLLDKSGINPLGMKVLMASLEKSESKGLGSATHGTALDRVLDTETVFGFYDMQALSITLTPIDKERADLGALPEQENYLMLVGSKDEVQEERREIASSLSIEGSLLWLDRLSGRTLENDRRVRDICGEKVKKFIAETFPNMGPALQGELFKIVEHLNISNPRFIPSNDFNFDLAGLQQLLSPEVWACFPSGLWNHPPSRIIDLMKRKVTSEVDLYALNFEEKNKAFLETWSILISKHFQAIGCEAYPPSQVRKILIRHLAKNKPLALEEDEVEALRAKKMVEAVWHSYYDLQVAPDDGSKKLPSITLSGGMKSKIKKALKGLSQDEFIRIVSGLRWEKVIDVDLENLPQAGTKNVLEEQGLESVVFKSFYSAIMVFYSEVREDLSPLQKQAYLFTCQNYGHPGTTTKSLEAQEVKSRYFDLRKNNENKPARGNRFIKTEEELHKISERLSVQYDYQLLYLKEDLLGLINTDTPIAEVVDLVNILTNKNIALEYDLIHSEANRVGPHSNSPDLAQKVLYKYLSFWVDNKVELMGAWNQLGKLVHSGSSVDAHLFQIAVLRNPQWDLSDPTECSFLLDFAARIADPEMRSRLTTMLVAQYLETASFEDKVHYLFGESATMVRDLVLQTKFLEEEVVTHAQLMAVRERIEETLEGNLRNPVSTLGLAALLDATSLTNTMNKMRLLLGTGESDRAFKEVIFESLCDLRKVTSDNLESEAKSTQLLNALVQEAQGVVDSLLGMSGGARYLVARHLLVKGRDPILLSKNSKKALFSALLEGVLTNEGDQREVREIIDEVLGVIAEIPEWEELYFAILPIVKDNILLSPQKPTPWSDLYAIEGLFGKPYRPKKQVKKRELDRLKATRVETKEALTEQLGAFIEGRYDFTEKREPMSPIDLIVTVAKHLGAPAVRFLQVLGQYVNIPPQYEEAFVKVYDEVMGQNKLFADALLEREWPEYRQEVDGLNFTAGGGPL